MGVRRRRRRLTVLLAALAATAVVATRVGRLEISGESMAPALRPLDRVLTVRGMPLHAGVLVAVPDPRERARLLVKRVEEIIGDEVYLAGDNPGGSTDSRTFGAVARSAVRGRVIWRYWPPERAGWLSR